MTAWAGRYAALRERLRGDTPLVLLLGVGGAGKTEALSLAAEELGAADRPVVRLRGRRLEARQPFAPFEDLLALPVSAGQGPAAGDATGERDGQPAGDATGERDGQPAGARPVIDDRAARRRVVGAVKPASVLLVDDVQWFDPASLRVLVALADRADEHGFGVVVAQRAGDGPEPAGTTPELAELRTVLGQAGPAIRLGPLTPAEIRERVARRVEAPVDDSLVDALMAASAGLCWLVDALLDWWRSEGTVQRGRLTAEPPAPGGPVADALARRLAHVDEADLAIARAQALGAPDDDPVVAEVAELRPDDIGDHLGHLRLAGLLAETDRVPEVVGQVLHDQTPMVERRRLQRRLADALSTRGAPRDVAEHLLAAGATGPPAAGRFVAAGDACPDPVDAERWYQRAVEAGAAPATVAARRAETALLAGDVDVALQLADTVLADRSAPDRSRALSVAAAGAVAAGDWSRAREWYRTVANTDTTTGIGVDTLTGTSADTTTDTDTPADTGTSTTTSTDTLAGTGARTGAEPAPLAGACAALAALVEGRVDEARRLVAERPEGPEGSVVGSLRATVDGLLLALAGDHRAGVRRLRRAAELLELAPAAPALPDSPHAIGAVLELLGGDPPAATQLAQRAIERRIGGGFLLARHRLLLGWAHLREARLPAADADLAEAAPAVPRDRLLAAALAAGLARRRGDLVALEQTWRRAEPVLLSAGSDLLSLEPIGELAAAAGRLDKRGRASEHLQTIGGLIDAVGSPPTWAVTRRWIELAAALNTGDHRVVEDAAHRLAELVAPTPALAAYAPAATAWAAVVRGTVDPDAVRDAADKLHAAGWSWEAAQLTGQAAIRVSDATVTRDLLGRARELKTVMGAPGPGEAKLTGLSEREVEVARLVVEGHTQKQIGALLYISAKTVEHHVAKIRQKLGAETRAEMLAALRTAFENA